MTAPGVKEIENREKIPNDRSAFERQPVVGWLEREIRRVKIGRRRYFESTPMEDFGISDKGISLGSGFPSPPPPSPFHPSPPETLPSIHYAPAFPGHPPSSTVSSCTYSPSSPNDPGFFRTGGR